jgi:hypothetical protein
VEIFVEDLGLPMDRRAEEQPFPRSKIKYFVNLSYFSNAYRARRPLLAQQWPL